MRFHTHDTLLLLLLLLPFIRNLPPPTEDEMFLAGATRFLIFLLVALVSTSPRPHPPLAPHT
jgi:hypothetical protein